jgi:hypothetical protein
VVIRIAHYCYYSADNKEKLAAIFGIVGAVCAFSLCWWYIVDWTLFSIPKMLLFITTCLFVAFQEYDDDIDGLWCAGIGVTVIAYLVCGGIWLYNIQPLKEVDVKETKEAIICLYDNSKIEGEIKGRSSILGGSVEGTITQTKEYTFYYVLEDGGMKMGSVPTSSTTVYYLPKDEDDAYLLTRKELTYTMNNNENPAVIWRTAEKVSYNLFIPEGSISNFFLLDGN